MSDSDIFCNVQDRSLQIKLSVMYDHILMFYIILFFNVLHYFVCQYQLIKQKIS